MDFSRTAKLIAKHESKEPWVYPDSRGIMTIGIGRNVDRKHKGPGLRSEEMEFMLQNDIEESFSALSRALPFFCKLSDVRQAVLMDMCHNLGFYGLLEFEATLAAFEAGDWARASEQMKKSLWYKQVGRRADVLRAMVTTNRWPNGL